MLMRAHLVVMLLAAGVVSGAGAATESVVFKDAEYEYSIAAPPGWELFPAEELPKELAALFFQIGSGGEPSGATLSVHVYPEQVHSELDLSEFVGLHQLSIRSLGLESEQITRRELGTGYSQRISVEYSLEEDGNMMWYKQMFYRVRDTDLIMLSAKNLADAREKTIHEFNEFFDNVKVVGRKTPEPTPEPLDLPTPPVAPQLGTGTP